MFNQTNKDSVGAAPCKYRQKGWCMLALAATGPVSRWFTLFHVVSSDFGGFCILFVSLSGWWFQRSFIFHNKKGLSSFPVTQWLDVLLRSWRQVADSGNWPWRGSRTGDGRSYSDGVAGSKWFQSVPTTAHIYIYRYRYRYAMQINASYIYLYIAQPVNDRFW